MIVCVDLTDAKGPGRTREDASGTSGFILGCTPRSKTSVSVGVFPQMRRWCVRRCRRRWWWSRVVVITWMLRDEDYARSSFSHIGKVLVITPSLIIWFDHFKGHLLTYLGSKWTWFALKYLKEWKLVEKDPKIPEFAVWVDELFESISALSNDPVINLILIKPIDHTKQLWLQSHWSQTNFSQWFFQFSISKPDFRGNNL